MKRLPAAAVGLAALAPATLAHDEALARALSEDARDVFYHVPPYAEGEEVYQDEVFAGPFDQAVGLAFDASGRLWIWQKKGLVWFVGEDGEVAPAPMLDLREEVGNWAEHGLIGFALDPDFMVNGLVYAFYVVDYHHLTQFGEPGYDPDLSEDFTDTQARITRFQVFDPTLPGEQVLVDPSSRHVLIGADVGEGFPICAASHGVGSLVFGADGSLLASLGDGFLNNTGSGTCLSDGLIQPKEDIDNFRAQLVDSMCGKILRVDPATGDGLPTNPFFDPAEPDAPGSRVWATGLRQPYRFSLRPGTGSAFDPGTLYVGDVGAQTWEELNIVKGPGRNLGWPLFEGMEPNEFYGDKITANLDAPNPLFGTFVPGIGLCDEEFFDFQDLLAQDTLGAVDLPNPCDPSQQVPLELQAEHHRPIITWKHDEHVALVKTYQAGEASYAQLGEPGSPAAGDPFPGNAAIGGVWYTGTDFPEEYQNAYFMGDYGEGWIKCFRFDDMDRLLEVLPFSDDAGRPVAFATHPTEGGLYYIDYAQGANNDVVRKISFVGDLAPVAVASVDVAYGPSPLTVHFQGDQSSDTEGGVTYAWDFGDGVGTSTEPNPSYVYASSSGEPTAFLARLTVTDEEGQTDEATVIVSVDNTPPTAQIVQPLNGAAYTSDGVETVPLESSFVDAEHGPGEVECQWEVTLHHDNHTHPEPLDFDCSSEAVVGAHTQDGDVEFYEVRLTVTDAGGLSGTATHYLPREDDCNLNGYPDAFDVAQGWSLDTDLDGVPDECAADCDADGLSDVFAIGAGLSEDCNGNGIPDGCDVAFGASLDQDGDGVPDECQPLSVDVAAVSVAAGGEQTMTLDAGAAAAGDLYWVLGSFAGTSPGTPFGPVTLPLVTPDLYFDWTLANFNVPPLVDTVGFLDASGQGEARFVLAAGSPPAWAGLTLHHAAIVVDAAMLGAEGIEMVTNPTWVELVP